MVSREFLLPINLKKSKKLWKFGFFHLWPLFGLQKNFWPFFNFPGLQTSWIFKIIQIWIILKQFCHWNNFCLKTGKPDQCVCCRLYGMYKIYSFKKLYNWHHSVKLFWFFYSFFLSSPCFSYRKLPECVSVWEQHGCEKIIGMFSS